MFYSNIFKLFSIFFVLYCLGACQPYGCTDPLASNYEDDALEDDGSCEYSIRTFSFYTNLADGGDIYIELSQSSSSSEYTYFGDEYLSDEFNFDPYDDIYPTCGSSNLASFQRYTNGDYYYDAHDKMGKVWSGRVSAGAGACQLIELPRDPNDYGTIHLYSDVQGTNGLNILTNPTGTSYDNDRTEYINVANVYSNTVPSCGSHIGQTISSASGTVTLSIKSTYPTYIDIEVSVNVPAQGCALVNLGDYI